MSEWGIPQGSTFGNAGGCFVSCLSTAIGLGFAVMFLCIPPQEKSPDNGMQSKIESGVSDTIVISYDTISVDDWGLTEMDKLQVNAERPSKYTEFLGHGTDRYKGR